MGSIRSFIIILTTCIGELHGFVPTNRRAIASFAPSNNRAYSIGNPPPTHQGISRTSSSSSLSSSREQAEQCLSESYPKFYSLLQQNPAALERMRESKSGFAVFAPSDSAMDMMGSERLQLLEAACNDPALQQVVSRMAAYHMVSAPATAEIMGTYNVVTTRVGELPVGVAEDGTLYVNGVQIIQSYQFEDNMVQNYQDTDGNFLGSEGVEGGKICIIHEVTELVCPDELWHAMYSHFEESSGIGTSW